VRSCCGEAHDQGEIRAGPRGPCCNGPNRAFRESNGVGPLPADREPLRATMLTNTEPSEEPKPAWDQAASGWAH
jgi:hypothetical protein